MEIVPSAHSCVPGVKFGWLTVTSDPYKEERRKVWVVDCICDCGTSKAIRTASILSGITKSCGCYGKEQRRKATTKHGEGYRKRSKMYNIWAGMIQRCKDPGKGNYKWYGGRGISVCSEWKADYTTFRDWALANGYEPGLEIDRFPDKNGNYCPENCRWVTHSENMKNRRSPQEIREQSGQ